MLLLHHTLCHTWRCSCLFPAVWDAKPYATLFQPVSFSIQRSSTQRSFSQKVKAFCPPIITTLRLPIHTNGSPSKTRFSTLKKWIHRSCLGKKVSPYPKPKVLLKKALSRAARQSEARPSLLGSWQHAYWSWPLSPPEATGTGVHETDRVTWHPPTPCFLHLEALRPKTWPYQVYNLSTSHFWMS